MIISANMFGDERTTSKTPISPDELAHRTKSIEKFFFGAKGMKRTDLTNRIIPLIAQIRASALNHDLIEPKGVAMLGSVGTGKTALMKLASYVLQYPYIEASLLAVEFSRNGANAFWSKVEQASSGRVFILDDIGSEPDARSFGNSVPMCELIYDRYSKWSTFGQRLWITSNLTPKLISERYGERCLDRIREMCDIIPATGDSLRG